MDRFTDNTTPEVEGGGVKNANHEAFPKSPVAVDGNNHVIDPGSQVPFGPDTPCPPSIFRGSMSNPGL